MKKLLRKLTAIIVAMLLALIPLTVFAKTPSTVYEDISMRYKEITYYDPLFIGLGNIDRLENNVDGGSWYIEGGRSICLNVHFLNVSTYRYIIVNANGEVVYQHSFYTDNCSMGCYIPYSGYYNFIIVPEGSVPAEIDRFSVWL